MKLLRRRGDLVHLSKTITFDAATGTGEVGAVPVFTTTGEVEVVSLSPICTVDLTEALPGSATLLLGVTGDTDLFIASTAVTAIDAGEFWFTSTPTAAGIALPAALKNIAISANIIGTVGTADVDAGAVRFDCWYRPLSADGALA